MNLDRKMLSGPFEKFRNGQVKRMRYRDSDHCPDNKTRGQFAESQLIVDFDRHDDAGWITISVEEITTSHSGRVAGRTISTTIPKEMIERLAEFIKTGG